MKYLLKKYLLSFISLLLFVHLGYTQESSFAISVKPFYSYMQMNAKITNRLGHKNGMHSTPELGFSVTASYARSIEDRWQISAGLEYTKWEGFIKRKVFWGNQYDGQGGSIPSEDPSEDYLYIYSHFQEIGLPVDLWLFSNGDKVKFFTKMGISPTWVFSYKGEYELMNDRKNIMDDITPLNFAFSIAPGIQFKVLGQSVYLAPEIHGYLLNEKDFRFVFNETRRFGLGLEMGIQFSKKSTEEVRSF